MLPEDGGAGAAISNGRLHRGERSGEIFGGGSDRTEGSGVAAREVVQANHRVAGFNESEAGVRADVSGPAGHEDALRGCRCAHYSFSLTHRAVEGDKPILDGRSLMISVSPALPFLFTPWSFRLTTATGRPQLNPLLLGRCMIGGILMGLANLVPGISGGTMLLAAGVYPTFVESVAAATTLSRKLQPWLLLAFIAVPAVLAIGVLAGTVRDIVLEHRWIAYSLFIGLTLGGAPTLWRMLKPMPGRAGIAALVAFVAMVALAILQESQPSSSSGEGGLAGLFIAGFAGAAAMVLPGVSGGYLLLVLGQYVAVLDAIDAFKEAIRAGELNSILQSAWPLLAIGIGVLLGVSLVSNIMRWLLKHHRDVTLGALLGLLLGAVAGLWPFREAVLPDVGSMVRGEVVETVADAEEIELKYRPTESYEPSLGQMGFSFLLVIGGGISSLLVGRLGKDGDDPTPSTAAV